MNEHFISINKFNRLQKQAIQENEEEEVQIECVSAAPSPSVGWERESF